MKIGSIDKPLGHGRSAGPYACKILKETRTTYHIEMFGNCRINERQTLSVPKAQVYDIEERKP